MKRPSSKLKGGATAVMVRAQLAPLHAHVVGDLHQPLHASDNHDAGGNKVKVTGPGPGFNKRANLHSVWDTVFVQRLGKDPRDVAGEIVGSISRDQARAWAQGSAADWAKESFALARDVAYRLPESGPSGVIELNQRYVDNSVAVVRQQLGKAGVRLAAV